MDIILVHKTLKLSKFQLLEMLNLNGKFWENAIFQVF